MASNELGGNGKPHECSQVERLDEVDARLAEHDEADGRVLRALARIERFVGSPGDDSHAATGLYARMNDVVAAYQTSASNPPLDYDTEDLDTKTIASPLAKKITNARLQRNVAAVVPIVLSLVYAFCKAKGWLP